MIVLLFYVNATPSRLGTNLFSGRLNLLGLGQLVHNKIGGNVRLRPIGELCAHLLHELLWLLVVLRWHHARNIGDHAVERSLNQYDWDVHLRVFCDLINRSNT